MEYGVDLAFLQDNYILIIVIAVVVVMTIIGFIADKKGFGKKNEKKVNKKNAKSNQEVVNDIQANEDAILNETASMDNFGIDEVAPVEENIVQNDYSDIEADSFENNVLENEIDNEPIQAAKNDNEVSNQETQEEFPFDENEQYKVDKSYDENLYDNQSEIETEETDLNMNSEVAEESLEQPEKEDAVKLESEEQFEMPNIDEVNNEIDEVDDDEDIWKF